MIAVDEPPPKQPHVRDTESRSKPILASSVEKTKSHTSTVENPNPEMPLLPAHERPQSNATSPQHVDASKACNSQLPGVPEAVIRNPMLIQRLYLHPIAMQ